MKPKLLALMAPLIVFACVACHPAPQTPPEVLGEPAADAWQTDAGGALLLASGLAEVVSANADTGDGYAGCLTGELVGELFAGAGEALLVPAPFEIEGENNPSTPGVSLDWCRCVALRPDVTATDLRGELGEALARTVRGLGAITAGRLKSCEARAWVSAVGEQLGRAMPGVVLAAERKVCTIDVPGVEARLLGCVQRV